MIEALKQLLNIGKKRVHDTVQNNIIKSNPLFFRPDAKDDDISSFDSKMNHMIIDWLIEVIQEDLQCADDLEPTEILVGMLYCSMELLYKVLLNFKGIVDLKILQCIAVVCFFIVEKYTLGYDIKERIGLITISDLTENLCSPTHLKNMEKAILDIVEWKVCTKTEKYITKIGKFRVRSLPINNMKKEKIKARSR